MKAVRIHQYGNVDTLRYEDADEPMVRSDDVLIRVVGTSVNPIDWKVTATDGNARRGRVMQSNCSPLGAENH